MAVAGLYRRILPSPPAIEFASSEGKQLFHEALKGGTMEGFFKLVSYFQTQSEPAYCGLASIAMVLNSLAIDPGRKWKGPWRWYDESMLDCCKPLEKVKVEGISFANVTCLARCSGAKVEAFHANETTIEEFRNHVIKCASSDDNHIIASYDRKAFNQTGSGHFSPIGGYHAGRDMVLILDVARFKYPPHWVPLTLLWKGMSTKAMGSYRGFMLLSRYQKSPSLLYTLSCGNETCVKTAKFLLDNVPLLLKSKRLSTVMEVLSTIFSFLPMYAGDFIKWIAEERRTEEDGNLSKEEKGRLAAKEEVMQQARRTELFKHVTEWLYSGSPCCLGVPDSSDKDPLPAIAASVYCQGAGVLTGQRTSKESYVTSSCVNCLKSNEDSPSRVVSTMVVFNNNKQGVDVLVPMSPKKSSGCSSINCSMRHPEINDVLTVLLLALPPDTWLGIKKEDLLTEIENLVSTDSLPSILQEEVLHLRCQLYCTKKMMENEILLKPKEENGEPTHGSKIQKPNGVNEFLPVANAN